MAGDDGSDPWFPLSSSRLYPVKGDKFLKSPPKEGKASPICSSSEFQFFSQTASCFPSYFGFVVLWLIRGGGENK